MSKSEIKDEIYYKLIYSTKRRLSIFREMPANKQGFVLLNLSKHIQQDILKKLEDKEIINLLHYLDPDEVTQLLQNVKNHRKEKIIKKLNEYIKEKVEFLLKFDPKTAAGIMSLDYVEINPCITLKTVSKVIKKHEKVTGRFPTILVVEENKLIGELPGHILALYGSKEKVEKHIREIPTIKYNKNEKDVIKEFKKHRHGKIVVLDEDNSVLGIIYSDDILRLLEKHSGNHLYDFAGVNKEEDIYDSAFSKVKYRYKWLIINLTTAFLAASVVSYFQNTISAFVLLAVYMPIIAGMGGNAGTQTLAVVIRGLALKEIELRICKRIVINEILAGIINGIINGIIVALVAIFINFSPLLGLIVGIAMVVNLAIAGFLVQ
jgi:magnesium transporter